MILIGSICLTDIPKELIKRVVCRDGKERAYLNISIVERKQPQTFENGGRSRVITHFVSCAPKKEERKDGVQYILGDLETLAFKTETEAVSKPSAQSQRDGDNSDLPF
ncbi:MAG: hypothetical protein ACI4SO_03750 [Muribaculaceae bacterium]